MDPLTGATGLYFLQYGFGSLWLFVVLLLEATCGGDILISGTVISSFHLAFYKFNSQQN